MKKRIVSFKKITLLIISIFTLLQISASPAKAGGKKLMKKSSDTPQLEFQLSLSHPFVQAGRKQRSYIKIGLTGFRLEKGNRAPVNLSVVLDRSGSMNGAKIQKAKEAAKMVLRLMQPNDIFSLVTYSSNVEVLVPATKVSDKAVILRRIDAIRASGYTALFAGVSKGIAEVKKFLDKKRVNRVILLSDGLANIGPSSPNALGRLGFASAKQGISITTVGLGLGYNEDLMTQLAMKSDGNHGFARNPQDLARIFRSELGDLLSVVAQKVEIKIKCAPGVRPVRVLERDEAQINGKTITLKLNQIYSLQEKFVLIEVEVPASKDGTQKFLGVVSIKYQNMQSHKPNLAGKEMSVQYSKDAVKVARKMNRRVMVEVVEAIANENNRQAIMLKDKGKTKEAYSLLMRNSFYLNSNAARYKSSKLRRYGSINKTDAKNLNGRSWKKRRKKMRKEQYKRSRQMTW